MLLAVSTVSDGEPGDEVDVLTPCGRLVLNDVSTRVM